MKRVSIPTKAIIYNRTKSKKFLSWMKTAGIVSGMVMVVIGVNTYALINQNHVVKAQDKPSLYNYLSKESLPQVSNVNLAVAAPNVPNTAINAQALNTAQVNLGSFAGQINQLQTQIVQQMQSCINLASNAQERINQLRAQEQQLLAQIRDYNRAFSDINSNTPNGPALREDLRRRRDEVTLQRREILRAINTTRGDYSRARSACSNQVNTMNRTKRNLENQLHKAYRNSLNVRIY